MVPRFIICLAAGCLIRISLFAQTTNEVVIIDSLPSTTEVEPVMVPAVAFIKIKLKIGDYAEVVKSNIQSNKYRFEMNLTNYAGDKAFIKGKYQDDRIYIESGEGIGEYLLRTGTGIETESGGITPGTEVVNADIQIVTGGREEVWVLKIMGVDTADETGIPFTKFIGFAMDGNRRIDLVWHGQHQGPCADSSWSQWVEFVEGGVSLGGKCGSHYLYRLGLNQETKFLVTALMVAADY